MVLEAFLLTLAVSIDVFASGFAYGANKIKIPFWSVIIINLIGTSFIALSLFFGSAIGRFIPPVATMIICVTVLILLGLFKIFGGIIRKQLAKRKNTLLKVCAAPEDADLDKSKVLSAKEAVLLAVALSLDGLAVGVGAGIANQNIIYYFIIIGFSLAMHLVLLPLGVLLGNRIVRKIKANLSWVGGLVLIAIAIMKIFY